MVAVKLAVAPAHIAPLPLIAIVGVTLGETTIDTLLDVAVAGEAQAALLVITTDTTSLLDNVVEVNKALLVPVLVPFTFHW